MQPTGTSFICQDGAVCDLDHCSPPMVKMLTEAAYAWVLQRRLSAAATRRGLLPDGADDLDLRPLRAAMSSKRCTLQAK